MVNQRSRAKILTKQHGNLDLDKLKRIQKTYSGENIWCYASTIPRDTKMPNFVDRLAIFIKQQQTTKKKVDKTNFG